MEKKIGFGAALSLMALTSAVTFVLTLSVSRTVFNSKASEIDRLAEKYARLDELDAVVRREFYQEVPEEDVLDGMLMGYVYGLGDRYSTYRSDREYEEYQDSNAGVYVGIGITVQVPESGDAQIVDVSAGGSAEKAGIEAGDWLVEVEDIKVDGNYQDAIAAIEGEVGTKVRLLIRKHDTDEEKEYKVARAKIDEVTVESEMLPDKVGYIRVSKFRTVTAEQFAEARQNLLDQGAKAFIFDVRDNGGGVLSALEKMVDPMLPEGELAFAQSRSGESSPIVKSDANKMEMPYAVLVNGNTASASELFACLMRDYADAVLVGEQTFGKGIMQTTFELEGGGVTLTTATYSTGKSPCYHEVGLEPDIIVEQAEGEGDTQLAAAQEAIGKKLADA